MSKIYIVQSSRGEYDDYTVYNERAFTNREKAEEYAEELNRIHNHVPSFVTPEFEDSFADAEGEVNILMENYPDFEEKPISNWDKYKEYLDQYKKEQDKHLIDILYKMSFMVTPQMLEDYRNYLDMQFEDWNSCSIEEIELV